MPPRDRPRVRFARVGDAVRDDADAVTVPADVVGDVGAAVERARDDEPDIALREHVGDPVARAGLRTGIGLDREAEAGREELGGVAGVAHPPFDVIEARGAPGRARARRKRRVDD